MSKNILEAKIEGEIIKLRGQGKWGFVSYLENKDLFFHRVNVVSMKSGEIREGMKVKYRIGRNYEGECAVDVELLD